MNPYASQLGDRDPLKAVAATTKQLATLVDTLGPERLEQSPAPGKWSAREILCRLADCEVAFAFRLRQALAEDHHVIQPFDQNKWASTYASCEAREALAVFSSLRQWNLKLIGTATPRDALKAASSPRARGDDIQGADRDHGGPRSEPSPAARSDRREGGACPIGLPL